MKKSRIMLIVILLITVLAACNQDENKNAKKKDSVTPVEISLITKGDMVMERSVYGRTAPSSTTPIILQTPGEIKTLEVQNGGEVEEDDIIATIQTRQGTQTIYAEASGEIAQLQGQEGTLATNEKPLAVIVDLNELTLNLTVTADATSLFEKGKKYPTIIEGTKLDAEITSIGTLPNETGLFPVGAKIPNNNNEFLPGMVAELNVPENAIQDALIIPTEAVVEESGKSFIYVIKNEKAIEKEINIIETQSDKTAFEGDMEKGDQVATSGKLTLTDGAKVNVVEEG